jgi:hypothetical protein
MSGSTGHGRLRSTLDGRAATKQSYGLSESATLMPAAAATASTSARSYGTRISPLKDPTRIIGFTRGFTLDYRFSPMAHCAIRYPYVDIGGSMGTVPRQDFVPNESMRHRELFLKKMALLICLRSGARARSARRPARRAK